MGGAVETRGEYPPEWPAIAMAVKKEAGWRCVRCGHPDPPDLKPRGLAPCDYRCTHDSRWVRTHKKRVLTVHHLDGDKANCVWWNLLPLCQVCHLQIQAKVDPRVPYLWEHTEWFRIYAAGFYALWFGGRQIERPETATEIQYWLTQGQPWLYLRRPDREYGWDDDNEKGAP